MSEEKVIANLIVIGVQKCGTTSLHEYLRLHPEVCMSREKEPDFFLWHFDRGLDWYRTLWTERARIYGESSTDYTVHPMAPGVPERIKSLSRRVRKPEVGPELRERLAGYFREDANRLRAVTGQKFSHWSV